MAEGDSGGSDVLGFTSSPWAQGGALALGGLGDIWAFIQNMQKQNALRNIYQILQDPSKLSAYAGGLMPQYSPAAISEANRGYLANQANLTGGATGGFLNQYLANAWAGRTAEDWQGALRAALGGLTGATGTASRYATPGIGGLGSVANALKILSQIRGGQQGQTPGITYNPIQGPGYPSDPGGLESGGIPSSFQPSVDFASGFAA